MASVSREIEPGGAAATTLYIYDQNLNPTSVFDPEGHETQLEYDERDLLVKTTRGVGASPPVVEQTTYDEDRQPNTKVQGASGDRTWEIDYDGFGRLAARRDPLGNETEVSYDSRLEPPPKLRRRRHPAGRGKVVFDSLGRRRARSTAVGPAPTQRRVSASFATTGRQPEDPHRCARHVTTLTYDAAERLYRQNDAAGNEIELELDKMGNPSGRLAASGRRWQRGDGRDRARLRRAGTATVEPRCPRQHHAPRLRRAG